MTSIDQVPPSYPNNDSEHNPQSNLADSHLPGTEFVDYTGTQRGFGGQHTPSHENNPIHPLDRDMDTARKRRRAVLIAAGGVAAVGAAFIGGKALIGEVNEKKNELVIESLTGQDISDNNYNAPGVDLDNNTVTLETPAVDYESVDVSKLTVDEFYDDSIYPESYRISWAHEQLRSRQTPELIKDFLTILENDNRLPQLVDIDFENPTPIEPSLDNSGDEILYQQGLDRYTASVEADPNVGRKLLAGVVTDKIDRFNDSLAQIGNNNQEPVTALYRVSRSDTTLPGQETGVFYETTVGDYSPEGIPSKFMKTKNSYDNTYSEIAVQFKENQWVTAYVILENSNDWIMRPEDLLVK